MATKILDIDKCDSSCNCTMKDAKPIPDDLKAANGDKEKLSALLCNSNFEDFNCSTITCDNNYLKFYWWFLWIPLIILGIGLLTYLIYYLTNSYKRSRDVKFILSQPVD